MFYKLMFRKLILRSKIQYIMHMTHIQETPDKEDDPISQAPDNSTTRLTVRSLGNIKTLLGKQVIFHFPRTAAIGPYTVVDIQGRQERWELTVQERPQKILVVGETEIEIL